jgi:histidyl-tRNA synthetase
LDPGGAAFSKQFKRADRSGAPWAAVLGEEEWSNGQVLLKPLRSAQSDQLCALDDVEAMAARLQA